MTLEDSLRKRVRPRIEPSDEEAGSASSSSSESDYSDPAAVEDVDTTIKSVSENETWNFEEDVKSISFGALAKAQDAIENRTSKSTKHSNTLNSLHPLKEPPKQQPNHRDHKYKDPSDPNNTPSQLRSSKHAPTEQSSKKPISRRREVLTVQKPNPRDPRFETLSGPLNPAQTQKNYAFLSTYLDSEILALRSAISKPPSQSNPIDDSTRSDLQLAIRRMESRRKTQQAKDQQQEILRAHRRRERELVQKGKKPFYLKKAEQKRRVLVERFEGLSAKQVDRAIERRRRKKAARERKAMPWGRRVAEDREVS